MSTHTIENLKDVFVIKKFNGQISSSSKLASNGFKQFLNTQFKDENNVSIANTDIANHTLCGFNSFSRTNDCANWIKLDPHYSDILYVHNKKSSATSGTFTLGLFYVRSDLVDEEWLYD